jgi:putative transposase
MSRFRLLPTPAQQAVLRDHCGHARYVWNLAVEQHSHWRPGRPDAPGYLEQCRQLTQARAEYLWLATGSQTVQQQALRDFGQAMTAFFDPANPAGRPSWRKAGRDEGFRITGRRGRQWDVRRLSRKTGQVWGAQGRVGPVPLVPRGTAGREVLPGDPGPRGPLACRLRRDPRTGSRTR